MPTFLVSIAAFAAILVPILARRYLWVVLTAFLCWGAAALVYWTAMTADPTAHPSLVPAAIEGGKQGAIYLVFATVLYGIKRVVLSSTPRKPPVHR